LLWTFLCRHSVEMKSFWLSFSSVASDLLT